MANKKRDELFDLRVAEFFAERRNDSKALKDIKENILKIRDEMKKENTQALETKPSGKRR
jgi:hypothetical protein